MVGASRRWCRRQRSVEYVREVPWQMQLEQLPCSIGMPCQDIPQDFRPLVPRSPALDHSGIEIHDPVFTDGLFLVDPALHLPVGTGGGG